MPMIDAILMELEDEAKRTERVLERIPEDKLAWRPHHKSFSLGQLAMHVAAQGRLAQIAAEEIHQMDIQPPSQPKSRREILDAFADGLASARRILPKLDDAALAATWTGQINGKTIMALPRASFLRMVMCNHIYHHRGQLAVYLRLLNVAVPSIYGPSADENPFAASAAA
jgi:uncharacterized damage-inducible protein DinB